MVLAAATVTCCWGGSSLTFDPDDRQLSQRRSVELSGAELARLKKRTYYERQRTRWWFRNRFRNLLQCTSSTIFYENVSLGSSGSGRPQPPANKKSNLFFAFLFQFVCASEKGDLESPMAASCVPAEDVETWVAAKLTTTTTTTEETRLPCSNNFFLSLSGAQLS